MRHDAFISYSHAADGPLAAALESGLEKLAKPLLRLRALDVFRDQTSLTAAPALWPGIVAHLEASEWFLMLASPQFALSVWCNKEVQWWLDNRSPDRMLVLLTEGDIAWDRSIQDFDWARTNSLPRLLERRCADEPLYVDFRWARGSELLTLRNAKFRDAVVNVAAPIRGVPKDELDGADLRQLARNRLLVRGGVAAITVAAVIAVWQAIIANEQRVEAERQRDIAIARQLAAQAELLRAQQPDRLPLALLMATEALRTQPDSLETQQTLRGMLARTAASLSVFQHKGPVSSARLSRDAEQVATAAPDDAGALWNVKDGKQIASLRGADRNVLYSPNGGLIAGCCWDVAVWNRQGEEQLRLTQSDFNGQQARNIAISPNGQTLAVSTYRDGSVSVFVFDIATKKVVFRKQMSSDRIPPIAYAPNGDFFTASGNEVEWYAADRWQGARRFQASQEASDEVIGHLAVSPDGQHLGASLETHAVLISLPPAAKPAAVKPISDKRITLRAPTTGSADMGEILFDARSRYVAALPDMGPATIWTVGNGRAVATANHGDFYTIKSLSFSPTQAEALTCATDGNCFTWSLADGRRLRQFAHVYAFEQTNPQMRPLGGGEYAAQGSLAVTSGRDHTARLWSLSDAAQGSRENCGNPIPYYSISIALSRSWSSYTRTRDSVESTCETRKDAEAKPSVLSAVKDVIAFTASADQSRVAALGRRNEGAVLQVWETASGRLLIEQFVAFKAGDVKLEPSGKYVVVIGESPVVPELPPVPAEIAVWEIASKRLVLELAEEDDTIALDITRDGTRLAAINESGELRVWPLPNGNVQRAVVATPGPMSFSHDGQWLAVGGAGSVRILNASTLRPMVQLEIPGRVHALGFRSNDSLLAVRHANTSGHMTVDLYRWKTDDLLADACARMPLKAATEQWRQLLPDQPVPAPCARPAAKPAPASKD